MHVGFAQNDDLTRHLPVCLIPEYGIQTYTAVDYSSSSFDMGKPKTIMAMSAVCLNGHHVMQQLFVEVQCQQCILSNLC